MLPKKWPRWIIIPLIFVLTLVITGIGLGVTMLAQASTYEIEVVPSTTPNPIHYSAPQSTECTSCHTDMVKLGKSAADEEEAKRVYIEPDSTMILHGKLGCITCHQGTSGTEDVETAHTNLIVDPSVDAKEVCLSCHHTLPNETIEAGLIAPHDQVVDGSAEDLYCSDCHPNIAHGDNPVTDEGIISMATCLDCHEKRNLEIQVEDCNACHTQSRVWSAEMECDVCHNDSYAASMENTDLLASAHAEEGLTCLDCHTETDLQVVHQEFKSGTFKFTNDFCLLCHVKDDIITRTTGFLINEVNINPHDPHADTAEVDEIKCSICHEAHEESPLVEGCNTCHHTGTYESCSTCHAE